MGNMTIESDLLGDPVRQPSSDRKRLKGVSTCVPTNIGKKLSTAKELTEVSENKFYQHCIAEFVQAYSKFSEDQKSELIVYASPRRGSDSAVNKNVYLPEGQHLALKEIAETHGYRVADLVLTALCSAISVSPNSSKTSAAA